MEVNFVRPRKELNLWSLLHLSTLALIFCIERRLVILVVELLLKGLYTSYSPPFYNTNFCVISINIDKICRFIMSPPLFHYQIFLTKWRVLSLAIYFTGNKLV